MIDPNDMIEELMDLSVSVNDFVSGEYWRDTVDPELQDSFTDQSLLNDCITLIVIELKEFGIYVDLEEQDYLSEFMYSEGIVAIRKYFDKYTFPSILLVNKDHIAKIKAIVESIDSEKEHIVNDVLTYCIENNIGDQFVLENITKVSDFIHSDEVFQRYILYIINYITDVDVASAIDTIKEKQDLAKIIIDRIYKVFCSSIDFAKKFYPAVTIMEVNRIKAEYLRHFLNNKVLSDIELLLQDKKLDTGYYVALGFTYEYNLDHQRKASNILTYPRQLQLVSQMITTYKLFQKDDILRYLFTKDDTFDLIKQVDAMFAYMKTYGHTDEKLYEEICNSLESLE